MNNRRTIIILVASAFLLLIACAIFAFLLIRSRDEAAEPTAVPTAAPAPTEPGSGGIETDEIWTRMQASGKMIVGLSADYPPFEFYDANFQLDGFDVALIRDVARSMGLELELKDMAFDGLGDALLLKQIDVAISAISVTDEREAQIDFSNTYMVSDDAVLANVNSGIESIPSEADLAELKVGVQSGSVYETWLETSLVETGVMPERNLILYRDIGNGVEDLSAGKIDLVALDLKPAEVAVETGQVKVVARGLNRQRFAMAIPPGSPVLQANLNNTLALLQGEGRIAVLAEQYLGLSPGEIPPLPTPDPSLPTPTPGPAPECVNGMAWVADLSFDDENRTNPPKLAPGEPFQKGWRVRNSGTCTWNSNYALIPVGGNNPAARMGGRAAFVQGEVQPGQTYDFWVDLVAPLTPGVYQEFWTMRDDKGILFGDRIWVMVEVVAAPTPTALPTQTPSADIQFVANPTQIREGECSTLTWRAVNVNEVYVYPQGEPWWEYRAPTEGSRVVCPSITTTYEMRVVKLDNSVEIRQVTLFVQSNPNAPNIQRFTVYPSYQINAGECVLIEWVVQGATSNIKITRNDITIWDGAPVSGSTHDCPPGLGEQIYGIEATGPGGTSRAQRSIFVVQATQPTPIPTQTPLPNTPTATPVTPTPVPPFIQYFSVNPHQIEVGGCVQIAWGVGGSADQVQILRNGIIVLDNAPHNGAEQDCLNQPGTVVYSVQAVNRAGQTASADDSVLVQETTPDNPLSGTSWNLLTLYNGQSLVPIIENTVVSAFFSPNNQLTGSGGCNSYSADYQVSGSSINVGPITSSQALCAAPPGVTEQENSYFALLDSAASYQINQTNLEIRNSSGQIILVYSQIVATPLEGPA